MDRSSAGAAGVNRLRRCCGCRSGRCASCGRDIGGALAPAISRSGASDLDRIDGFDASFSGWGREDSDLLVRLLHAGVRRKDGRFATAVIHLWHPEADRAQLTANEARLDAVLASDRVRAQRGMSALSHASP